MELAERRARDEATAAERRARDEAAARSFDYVTVGHVTVDVMADGSRRPGGGAFYSALQAARLGLRTLIVTQGSAREIEALVEPYRGELELRILPAPATTTLATTWSGGTRTQRLLAWAGPIAEEILVDTQILHFAPVARETSATWRGHADFVGFTPQGHARAWDKDGDGDEDGDGDGDGDENGDEDGDEDGNGDEDGHEDGDEDGNGDGDEDGNGNGDGDGDGEIVPAPLPTDRRSLSDLLPDDCNAVVISEQERAACAPLLAAAAAGGAVLAITAGAGATSVQEPGGAVTQVQAPAVADPRDDLGAGDVFAAAFFVALREGHSPPHAAAYGNAAAAIRIEGLGAGAIGDRDAIEARVAKEG